MFATIYARSAVNPGNPLLLLKLWHVVDGIYMWEFVTTMDYDWSIIRGQRPYRWTIWIYQMARVSTLTSIIMNLVFLNVTMRFNCLTWVIFTWIFSFAGVAAASLLIVLRIIAIWHNNNVALGIASVIWLVNLAFILSGIIRIHATWNPETMKCVVTNLETSKPSLISMFITDFLLLIFMLAGLLRLRRDGGNTFELGRILWRQGLIWLTIGAVTEFVQMVFLILDINDAYDNLFTVPCQVALIISTTRMYRALADFSSSPGSKTSPFVRTPSSQLEVTVHKAYEEHAMSHTAHFSSSYPGSDGQLHDKPHEIRLDDDNMDDHP